MKRLFNAKHKNPYLIVQGIRKNLDKSNQNPYKEREKANFLFKMKILSFGFGTKDLHNKFVYKIGLKKGVAIVGLAALLLMACDKSNNEATDLQGDVKDKIENATADNFWDEVDVASQEEIDKKNAELDKKNAELDKKNAELDRREEKAEDEFAEALQEVIEKEK